VLEHVIEPVCIARALEVKRSDLDPTPGQITTQIVRNVIAANVIIADLTGRNPNVYFELGVAQAFAKPLILLVKDASQLPFDVKNERMIEIGDGEVLGVSDAKVAAAALEAALDIVLSEDYQPSNLVTDVAAARALDALAPTNPFASELSSIRESVDEVHSLLRASLRRTAPPDRRKDFNVLASFIRDLVEADRLYPQELRDLVNAETSPYFDDLVEKMAVRADAIEASKRTYGDEEPF